MKIAVPVTNSNQIDDHFGHCEFYNVYTISEENNDIINVESIESKQGCGCKSNIASTLAEIGVKTMLAGGIGNGAINVLNNAGIDVIRGCSGDPTDIVKQYTQGLVTDSGPSCNHHDHEHQCSHH